MFTSVLTYLKKWSLLFLISFTMTTCQEDNTTTDLHIISTELRTRVNRGIINLPDSYKETFYQKLKQLELTWNLTDEKSLKSYQEEDDSLDYQVFKSFITEHSPDSYYLLMDIFLKGEIKTSSFNYIFADLIESAYPGLMQRITHKLEDLTIEDFVALYPEICIEHLLAIIE